MITSAMLLTLTLAHSPLVRDEVASLRRELERLDRTLTQLEAAQRTLRTGGWPNAEVLDLAASSRESILATIRPAPGAMRTWLRRLELGFSAELRDLAERRQATTTTVPLASPVLQVLYELESEWTTTSRARLEALVQPEPTGAAIALATPAELQADRPTTNEAPATDPSSTIAPSPHPLLSGDLSLEAGFHYEAGDFARALELYRQLEPKPDEGGAQLRYRIADCLLQLNETDEAITLLRELAATESAGAWRRQAEWSASYAEALQVVRRAREGRTGKSSAGGEG